MSDENTTATAATTTTPTTTTATNGAAATGTDDGPVNIREIKELRIETRETQALLKQLLAAQKPAEPAKVEKAEKPEKPKDGDAALAAAHAAIEEMRFDQAFTKAMVRAKIADDHPAYELIEKVAKLEKPQDLAAFIAKYAGAVKPQTAPVVEVKKPTATSDTGAAVATQTDAGTPTGHPFRWPESVLAKMSPAEIRAAASEFEAKNGGGTNVTEWQRGRRAMGDAAKPKK